MKRLLTLMFVDVSFFFLSIFSSPESESSALYLLFLLDFLPLYSLSLSFIITITRGNEVSEAFKTQFFDRKSMHDWVFHSRTDNVAVLRVILWDE